MNIDLGHVGSVVIDDMTDVRDIDTATGDICSDEDLEGTVAEAAQGALTCALTLVSMDGESFEAISLKEPDYLVASVFGTAEDKHLFGAFFE